MRVRTNLPTRPPRPEKVESIEALDETLKNASGAVVTDYRGLTVKAISELRAALRPHGAKYEVVKNTLLKRAANEQGYGGLEDLLEGPSATLFLGEDIVAPTKVLLDFVRTHQNLPVVKGGVIEGRRLDLAQVRAVADLPSREMLLAGLVGTLQSPMGSLLSTLQAAMSQLVGTLQSLETQKGGAA